MPAKQLEYSEDARRALKRGIDALADAMEGLPAKLRQDDDQLREAARRVLRRALNERFGKRPLIEIQLVRL